MTDISDIYLKSREHSNAVSSLDWADLEGAGIDPGKALLETPVYDSIEERLEGDQMVKVGIGDENTGQEKRLSSRDATEQEKLYGGELSISNRGPESLREKFLYSSHDILMEEFGMSAYDARNLTLKIFGANPGDDTAPNLGIGLTDFLGLGEIFAIQESVQQFKRGVETTGKMDAAIGGAVATASAIPFGVLAARMLKSKKAKELLQTAKERWEAGGMQAQENVD
jgi:hypothetical protein